LSTIDVKDAAGATRTVQVPDAPAVRTPSLTRTSGSGTVQAGSVSVTIANTGGAAGQVLGSALKPGESVTFSAVSPDTLAPITFDAAGTEFVIVRVS